MTAQKIRMLFLNFGHFADHLFMLIFAKAALSAGLAFGLAADGAYAEMIPYGVPSLILFGACAPLAAHMADVPSLKEAFANGEDIHSRTASEMFGEVNRDTRARAKTKTINNK